MYNLVTYPQMKEQYKGAVVSLRADLKGFFLSKLLFGGHLNPAHAQYLASVLRKLVCIRRKLKTTSFHQFYVSQ